MCICMVVGLVWPRYVSLHFSMTSKHSTLQWLPNTPLLNDFQTLYISQLYAVRFWDLTDFPSLRTAYVHLKFWYPTFRPCTQSDFESSTFSLKQSRTAYVHLKFWHPHFACQPEKPIRCLRTCFYVQLWAVVLQVCYPRLRATLYSIREYNRIEQ